MHNFIIVGTPRTGSSFLAQLINFHPQVACGWQWTASIPWWNKINITQRSLAGDFSQLPENDKVYMESTLNSKTKQLGFRALFRSSDKWLAHPRFSPVFWMDRLNQHIRWIERRPQTSIIHITRTDNLAWLKSYMFSRATNNYIDKPYPEGLSVRIGLREAVARVRSKQWLDGQLANLVNTNPYHRVQYESLCEDKLTNSRSILNFLQCDLDDYAIDEDVLIKKQSKGAISKGIENYDDIVSMFIKNDLMEARFA